MKDEEMEWYSPGRRFACPSDGLNDKEVSAQVSDKDSSTLPRSVGLANPSHWLKLRQAIVDAGEANMTIDDVLAYVAEQRGRSVDE